LNATNRGVLLIDTAGDVRFASGLGLEPLVQRELIARSNRLGLDLMPEVFAIEDLKQPLGVMVSVSNQGALFMIQGSDSADPLLEFIATVPFAGDILRHFVTNPYEAMTVVDADGLIRYISPVHEKFFKISHGAAIGKPAREVIENTRLDVVLRTGRAEIGQSQEMKGTTRVVNRTPIVDRKGKVVGAIGQVMFKSPDAVNTMNAELNRLRQEVDLYRRVLTTNQLQHHGLKEIVGKSQRIEKLKDQITKVADLDVPVLITGESGVGKDLVAHAIHALSARSNASMVVINAAALPDSLVESELFGYEGGSFTGADRKGRRGKFAQANGGTLFLDEIADTPLETQAKLLRTLQDGTFSRIGGEAQHRSDFRLIAASNRDFQDMLATGQFRLDLFYRISTVTLRVPALRERLEDIPLLVEAELERFASRHGTPIKKFSVAAMDYLQSLPWPGNVRQLQHVVARAAIFTVDERINIHDLQPQRDDQFETFAHVLPVSTLPAEVHRIAPSGSVQAAKSSVEAEMIRAALTLFKGNKKKVAEHLGISRSYLYKKLAQLNL
jgi:transcriptional regulator with PAS, ATPase and Fis domain